MSGWGWIDLDSWECWHDEPDDQDTYMTDAEWQLLLDRLYQGEEETDECELLYIEEAA